MGGYYPGRGGRVRGLSHNQALGRVASTGYNPRYSRHVAEYRHAMTQSPGHYNKRRGDDGGRHSLSRVVGNRRWDPRRRKWVKLADDPRHRVVGNKRWDPRKRRWVKMKNDPRQRYNNMSGGRGKKWDPRRRKWVKASVYKKSSKRRRRR